MPSQPPLTVAVTSGEPAGIGPDLCVLLTRERFPAHLVLIGDCALFEQRARLLDLALTREVDAAAAKYSILHVPVATPVEAGTLNPGNARYVLGMLDIGIDGCVQRRYAALVTAPVQKSVINEAGVTFSGHTEYLAQRTGTAKVVMMLVGGGLRVALASTHLALREVAASITRENLSQVIAVLHADLRGRFGIAQPRILVAGLNPHAGEAGHLGREEIEVIAPVLTQLRAQGMNLTGPLPADTLFTPQQLNGADCVLAMYHDQGLPVLKYASFGAGVNVTLGLPIIRTSVDHGTALDRAGTGAIDTGSMVAAVNLAIELAQAAMQT